MCLAGQAGADETIAAKDEAYECPNPQHSTLVVIPFTSTMHGGGGGLQKGQGLRSGDTDRAEGQGSVSGLIKVINDGCRFEKTLWECWGGKRWTRKGGRLGRSGAIYQIPLTLQNQRQHSVTKPQATSISDLLPTAVYAFLRLGAYLHWQALRPIAKATFGENVPAGGFLFSAGTFWRFTETLEFKQNAPLAVDADMLQLRSLRF